MWGVAKSSLRAVFSRPFWFRLLPLEAIRAWLAIRRPGWHLTPDPGYVSFRLVTAYGSEERPPAEDLNEYLVWRRRHRRARR